MRSRTRNYTEFKLNQTKRIPYIKKTTVKVWPLEHAFPLCRHEFICFGVKLNLLMRNDATQTRRCLLFFIVDGDADGCETLRSNGGGLFIPRLS